MRFIYLTFSVLLYLFSPLSPGAAAQPTTPEQNDIQFRVGGKVFKTHYLLYGNPLLHIRTPLIVLHGGPGLSCDYMLPLGDLSLKYRLPIILYDQIGNGRSSHNQYAPSSFWTLDLFMDELQNLINFFGITTDFSLVGHGWGSTLALEFAVRRQPQGLKSLILSDGLASKELYQQSTAQLLQNFPESVQQGLINGFNDPPAFEAAFRAFYAVHGCRVTPSPKEENQTLQYVFGTNGVGDNTVAKATGIIPPDWSIIDRLPLIKTKTLVINGRYSVSQDFVIAPFVELLENVKWVRFENSSQMPWWEEPSLYRKTVGEFLTT